MPELPAEPRDDEEQLRAYYQTLNPDWRLALLSLSSALASTSAAIDELKARLGMPK